MNTISTWTYYMQDPDVKLVRRGSYLDSAELRRMLIQVHGVHRAVALAWRSC